MPQWLFPGRFVFSAAIFGVGWLILSEQKKRRLRNWSARWKRSSQGSGLPRGGGSELQALRQSLPGRTREQVLELLGSPVAAAADEVSHSDETWYYPLNLAKRIGIALTFKQGAVSDVEWITGPMRED